MGWPSLQASWCWSVQDARDFADRSIDLAAGLGKHVVVVGTSGRGAVDLWAAAERPEVTATSPITSRMVLVGNDAGTTLDPRTARNSCVGWSPGQLTVIRIPASLGLGHDIVGFQRSNSSHPHLSEAYQYLSETLGIPLGDPKAAA